jgi:RNA 3'-terminal phosphate cyclase (ATP)
VTHQADAHRHQEVFTLLGVKCTSAENIGSRLAGLIKRYLFQSEAVIDDYLTDQLLLPLALAGGGEFTSRVISQHTQTQAWLIEQFLPVQITFKILNTNKTLVQVIV